MTIKERLQAKARARGKEQVSLYLSCEIVDYLYHLKSQTGLSLNAIATELLGYAIMEQEKAENSRACG